MIVNSHLIPKNKRNGNSYDKVEYGFIYEVKYIGDGSIYHLKHISYDKQTQSLYLEYKGNRLKPIHTSMFINGSIGGIIEFEDSVKREGFEILTKLKQNLDGIVWSDIKSGDIIETNHFKFGRNDFVFERYDKNKQKLYLIKDGITLKPIKSHDFITGRISRMMNLIIFKAPWMIDLGVSEEDAKTHTYRETKRIDVICKKCGTKGKAKIMDIYANKSISCKVCGDGFSYPEKFMMSVLNQLEISFETQITNARFEWCDKYRYDFYLPEYNMIIETHGIQHYEETNWGKVGGRTLEEEQENDRFKKELALTNGIDKYIVIDCRYSDLKWIKNNILNSELNKLFKLDNIDWKKCDNTGIYNSIKCEIWEYWNDHSEEINTKTIAKKFGIGVSTARKYLKQGNKYHMCTYDTKEEIKKNHLNLKLRASKMVVAYKEGELEEIIFNSISEVEKRSLDIFGVKMNGDYISKVCKGELDNYKGYKFKFYIQNN